MPSSETRIEDPAIAQEVASEYYTKLDRDTAALSRRAIELISDTPGSDIDKINTFATLKTEDKTADMAYQLMHPIDNFPGVPTLAIRTSEEATEDGTWISESSDERAGRAEDRKLADIEARQL